MIIFILRVDSPATFFEIGFWKIPKFLILNNLSKKFRKFWFFVFFEESSLKSTISFFDYFWNFLKIFENFWVIQNSFRVINLSFSCLHFQFCFDMVTYDIIDHTYCVHFVCTLCTFIYLRSIFQFKYHQSCMNIRIMKISSLLY